ncbi:MAG: glucose-1-phosphate adenylyltransferase [Planctomycetes bacterium]|nr:glucose-1-phosphate adenylyltransferase [Planctomycetota bacterium]
MAEHVSTRSVLAVILGGGVGTRLYPLTKFRAKPAVPIAGKYRLIDIPISNCLNSDINRIYVLTQFSSRSLNSHISQAYRMDSFSQGFIEIIAAAPTVDHGGWFQGTADAVRQCLRYFSDPSIRTVLILSGDQLYTADFRRLLALHAERKADLTIACKVVTEAEAPRFGIMRVGAEDAIVEFAEKPGDPASLANLRLPGGGFLASMGIYVFRLDVLQDLLLRSDASDFGAELIPAAIETHRVHADRFEGYWEDIGTIRSFYEANLRFLEPDPPIDLRNPDWPIFTRSRYLSPSRIVDSRLERCLTAEACEIDGAEIRSSIVGIRSVVRPGTRIDEAMIMGAQVYEGQDEGAESAQRGLPPIGIGRDCVIRRAILDHNVRIGDGVRIENAQGLKTFQGPNYMIRDGIVVVEKNAVIPPGAVI